MKIKEVHLANHICHWLLRWGATVWIQDSMGVYDPTRKAFRKNQNPYRIDGQGDIMGSTGKGGYWVNIGAVSFPRALAVEVKLPGETQRPSQIEFEKRWVDAGNLYILAYSLLDVKTKLQLPDTIEWPKTVV